MSQPASAGRLRPLLYRRLQVFLPFIFHPLARRFWRLTGWLLLLAYFAFAALILVLRYSVIPNIELYRGEIEQQISRALALPVSIGRIDAGWYGLRPDLVLSSVRVHDAAGRPALALQRVEAVLDWSSLLYRELRLGLLAIDAPELHVRRAADGAISVAGIELDDGDDEPGAAEWVLLQKHIRISGASLIWEDELRQAPPLALANVNIALDRHGREHRFGINALPPGELAERLDLRGRFRAASLANPELWSGELFTELDYVDLAGWRAWVDYPLPLANGRGALRAWLRLSAGHLLSVRADLALDDVRLRLASDLPELLLTELKGGVDLRFDAAGASFASRALAFRVKDGPDFPATDLSLTWQDADALEKSGSLSANHLDLARLRLLAGYLPLSEEVRAALSAYAPSGELSDLTLAFTGSRERLRSYRLRSSFSGLGVAASGATPGLAGLAGSVEANEAGGRLSLASREAALDLPQVFPESRLAFDTLAADLRWQQRDGALDLQIERLEFANADAAGSARGSYRYTGSGAGSIDLEGGLQRARGNAVWRYMPHAVDADARRWLRQAIRSGKANNTRLVLKGKLDDFPFLDGSGSFLVTTQAQDVVLDYAPGWPRLENLAAELRFAGAGMQISGAHGSILGARISATEATIADFEAEIPHLQVAGTVSGPGGEFFRFIDASPVAAAIHHATSSMRLDGPGELRLALDVPLADPENTAVQGEFRFSDNRLFVSPWLAPLTGVSGKLEFSEAAIRAPQVNAFFLGGPVAVRADTDRDGHVRIAASGRLNLTQAKNAYPLPLFDYLAGETAWTSEIDLYRTDVSLRVASDLVGISSRLPAGLGKAAGDRMPLRFAKTLPAPGEEAFSLQLGEALSGTLRQLPGPRAGAAQAWLALGSASPAPPQDDVALLIAAREIDLDFWRSLFARPGGAAGGDGGLPAPLRWGKIKLQSERLLGLGQRLHDVDLALRQEDSRWFADLTAREASGSIVYDQRGRGSVQARLQRLYVAADEAGAKTLAEAASERARALPDELPALDVVAESFALGKRELGRLELTARNAAVNWRIEKLTISNPDATLAGSGIWQMQAPQRFDLNFSLKASNAGQLLARLGYPDTLTRGAAKLAGRVGWLGAPTRLDYPSLFGEIEVKAERGQFAKLNPGAAGRLVGLISLQSLPRRIALDFNDVFSAGFAFDTISGAIRMQNGIMHSDRLQIDGPSARVLMRGEVDLARETQKLVVNVQPELGSTAALGVALVNPVMGAAALFAHKVLQNPLNQIFSFDYAISGGWDDPQVEKLPLTRFGGKKDDGQ